MTKESEAIQEHAKAFDIQIALNTELLTIVDALSRDIMKLKERVTILEGR